MCVGVFFVFFFTLIKSLWSFIRFINFVQKSVFDFVAILYSTILIRWPDLGRLASEYDEGRGVPGAERGSRAPRLQ